MNVIDAAEIAAKLSKDAADYVARCDAEYMSKVKSAAETVARDCHTRPLVLLSGPSGSGKTTTAMLLERYLDSMGVESHTISMDNYFASLTDKQIALMRQGKLDLESPARVDTLFLNDQLRDIWFNREVEIPRFDFVNSRRVGSGWFLKRKEGELIIIEGIHALNPEVITISDEHTHRIYISLRTTVSACGNTLTGSMIRLMRRILRDIDQRDRPVQNSIDMLHSVEHGEKRYIAPHRKRASIDIDTFIEYELCVYKSKLLPLLEPLSGETAEKMSAVLRCLPDVDAFLVPRDSLIREFIGGSVLKY